MAGHTHLLTFQPAHYPETVVNSREGSAHENAVTNNKYDFSLIITLISEHLESLGLTRLPPPLAPPLDPSLGPLVHFVSPDGCHATLRGYPKGPLVMLDLHEYVAREGSARLTPDAVKNLEHAVGHGLARRCKTNALPVIRRGDDIERYYPLVDGSLIEYDFTEVLHCETSKYQDILIVHSPSFGNVLILDGDINLAESDVVYSHTLMQRGRRSYADRTCLILGGGDGGLLHEILKEGPRMVTMIDVDVAVVNAARKHLKGVCGDSLDTLIGPRHEVVVGDAIEVLRKYGGEGRRFDYVLYDLTAVPFKSESCGDAADEWHFWRLSHGLALAVLAPDGVYMAQANARAAAASLALYECMLRDMAPPVEWRRHEAYIPSYHESWVFYEMWKVGGGAEAGEERVGAGEGRDGAVGEAVQLS